MIDRRPLLTVAAGCGAATVIGVIYIQSRTVALAAALALVAALAAATALKLRPAPRHRSPTGAIGEDLPLRLRQIVDAVRESERSEFGVDRSLRPVLVPIAIARLGRRGVDMALAPQRAEELLGDVLWNVVRPDRPSAERRTSRGLARDDLRTAIERLEQL